MIQLLFSPQVSYAAGGLLGGLSNKPGDISQIMTLVNNVKGLALGIAGIVVVAMIIWGGVMLITSAGDPEKVKKGRGVITAAIIGLLLIIAAQAITLFLSVTLPGAIN